MKKKKFLAVYFIVLGLALILILFSRSKKNVNNKLCNLCYSNPYAGMDTFAIVALHTGLIYPLSTFFLDDNGNIMKEQEFFNRIFLSGYSEEGYSEISVNSIPREFKAEAKIKLGTNTDISYSLLQENFCDSCCKKFLEGSHNVDVAMVDFYQGVIYDISRDSIINNERYNIKIKHVEATICIEVISAKMVPLKLNRNLFESNISINK